MGIKDEELEGLSDEERAALEDEDDESEILGKIAGDDGSDDDEGDDDDESTSADSDKESAGNAADDAGEGGKQDGAETGIDGNDETIVAAEPVAEFRPEFKATVPDGLSDRLAALDQQESDIEKEFDEGNLERDEMRKQLKTIANERTDLKIAESQANWAKSQNDAAVEQRWKWEQERFFGQATADIYKDGIVMAALNASVVQLSNDPANSKRAAAWFLEEADRQVRSRFNMGQPVVKDAKPNNRQPDLSKVPKTLAQLPAAEMSETGDVEFAYLDKLDGIALEAALRKMTPEQEARYLGAAA